MESQFLPGVRAMHIIARPKFKGFVKQHPRASTWLENWWRVANTSRWESLGDVRRLFASADQVGGCLVFNALGNNFRLIVGVKYADDVQHGTLWIKHFF